MKYCEKYKDRKPPADCADTPCDMHDSGIAYVEEPGKCFECLDKTNYADVGFECYICSEECLDRILEGVSKCL